MNTGSKATVTPYLSFSGNCWEVMTFYKVALNGKLDLMEFAGSPVEGQVPDDYKHKVLHATLTFGDAMIMASDSLPGMEVNMGNGYSISISTANLEEAERFFNNLAKGGKITMPFAETFWAARYGMLTDKYGVSWMVNCEVAQQPYRIYFSN